ncbi:MAG TPA: MFS transporter [Aggregatilineaceae bacterium]|nr:MFS transporter [Aggregatilineaceae bacterium]
MTQPFARDRFTWLAYLMLGYFAYLEAVLGPAMPFLKDDLHLEYWEAGLHSSAVALGVMINGIAAAWIVNRWGRRITFWAGGAGMAAGVLLLVWGRSLWITIPGAFIMGLWGGFLLITIQAALSDRHGQHRMVAIAEANVIASIATMFAPMLTGNLERFGFGWRGALYVMVFVWGTLLLMFWREPFPESEPISDANREAARRPLPPVFWAYLAALLLVVALEWCMILWAADFLNKVVDFSKEDASSLITLFFLAMVIGRFAGSRLARTMRSDALLAVAIGVTAVGFPIFWLSPLPALNVLGLFLCGLGVANLYPIGVSLALSIVPKQATTATAILSVGVSSAIMIVPQLLAAAADAVGIRTAYGLVVIIIVCGSGLMVFANRLATRHNLTAET